MYAISTTTFGKANLFLNLSKFFLLLFWVEIHCSIYKGSYNVSNILYLNSPSTTLLYLPSPDFLQQFQQVSFLHLHTCVYIICNIFTLLPLFPSTSPFPLVQNAPPQGRTCSAHPPFLQICKKKYIYINNKKRNMTFLLV
jgi:hypothetical protein